MREELYLLPPLQDLLPHRNNRSSRATRSKLFKPTWRGTASSAPNGDDRMRTGRLAAWVRDQEVHALEQRNEELERALVEANSVMRVFGSGGGNGQAAAEPMWSRTNSTWCSSRPSGFFRGSRTFRSRRRRTSWCRTEGPAGP